MNIKDILITGLRGMPALLAEFVESIPSEQQHIRRKKNFWTIAEHVVHLAEVQPMLLERLQRIQNEDKAVFVPFFPGDEDETPPEPAMTVSQALEQFSTYRKRQLDLVENATAKTWEKSAVHPEYSEYGFHILVRHMLMHEHWHMYRVEELWLTKDEYLTNLEG